MQLRRWSELDGLERVWLYTRQSLYFVLVLFSGGIVTGAAVRADGGEVAVLVVGGVLVTGAGIAVLRAVLGHSPTPRAVPVAWVVPLLVVAGAFYVVSVVALDGDQQGAGVTAAVASFAVPLGLLPLRWVSGAVIAVSVVLFTISGGEAVNALAGFAVAGGLVFTSRASAWVLGVVTELDDARRAQGQLAVVQERLRFSRDVHDVLGRRLSTIAVQSELAATLAERGDARAAEQMLEVRGVAHEALREARELARGYRSTDFAQELEGARSLLRSAGIEVAADVAAMPRGWHEAAGWVVRESVTNVLRHSSATRVEIGFEDETLRVGNDGARPSDGADGSGLQGLRERLAPLGATLDAGADGDRFLVVAHLPGSGPLSARSAR
jgi:two-component system, NarL family, sensor histidine kinase DesK